MSATSPELQWPVLQRASRAIVVADLVESVRLIEEDEEGTVRRWQSFVSHVSAELLPRHGGRLVKSLGDGLMVEFKAVPSAVQCAIAMQTAVSRVNENRERSRWLALRIGVHAADIIIDALDVYGSGVNLAARLSSLAGPGEVVVSTQVRDLLVAGLDADLEDMGLCYLKHLREPVRTYRVTDPSQANATSMVDPPAPLLPVIAVVPLVSRADTDDAAFIGRVVAHDLTAALAKTDRWQVVSSLSTAPFAQRAATATELRRALGADYVVSGTAWVRGSRVKLSLQLADTRRDALIWTAARTASMAELFSADGELVPELVRDLSRTVLSHELFLARSVALPTLPGYTLLLHAIASMHKLLPSDVALSRQALERLVEHHPRSADVRAWLAKWHFMQLPQARTSDPAADITQARSNLQRALDAQPEHALSMALLGHLSAYVDADLPTAEASLRRALSANPNEPLAWLFLANVLANAGRADEAVAAVQCAQGRSPLDPMGYFFDTIAAGVYNAANRFDDALAHALRSVAANAAHLPGLAELIIAQQLAGRPDDAARTAQRYLALRPDASVGRFLRSHPAGDGPIARRDAKALQDAGIPA